MCKKTYLELENPVITPVENAGFPKGLLRLDYRSGLDGAADYAMVRPPASQDMDWVVVIHGHGAHGNQLYLRADIKRAWLTAYLEQGVGIITPNLRDNAWMNPKAVNDMDALLDFARRQWNARRFIFSSGSMGGTSNLIYASLRPENVAGVVSRGAVTDLADYLDFCRRGQEETPILREIGDCIIQGYGKPDENPELYRLHSPVFHPEVFENIPVCLLHGTRDLLMSVSQSRKFAAALADNPLFSYIEIPGGSHDSPLTMVSPVVEGGISPLEWARGKARI